MNRLPGEGRHLPSQSMVMNYWPAYATGWANTSPPWWDSDLDLLALWAVHTHLVMETYTTPRLLIDSPVEESGKTTVLEHLERVVHSAVHPNGHHLITGNADSACSKTSIRTVLIDEADRCAQIRRKRA